VLTFAPEGLMALTPPHVRQLDDYTLEVETTGRSSFARAAGRIIFEGTRRGPPLRAGEIVRRRDFDTEVVAVSGDEGGLATAGDLRTLRFRFHRPLASPEYRFFISTPDRPAAWVPLAAGVTMPRDVTAPPPTPAWLAQHRRWLAERDFYCWMFEQVGRVSQSDIYLTREKW
jgi:hypothetical protein